MSDLGRAIDALAGRITPPQIETIPHPVIRRWGVIDAVNTDGTYDVTIGGVVVPDVKSIAGVYVDGETCVVEFAGADPVIAGRVEDRWHDIGGSGEPSFLNNWVDYGNVYATAAFRKVAGVVYLRGLVKNGSVPATVFTLPAGYRPSAVLIFACATDPNAMGRVDVAPDGAVVAEVSVVNSYLSLDNICFVAES